MKAILTIVLTLAVMLAGVPAWAEETALSRDAEIEDLKARLEKLESTQQEEKKGSLLDKVDVSGFVTGIVQGSVGNEGGDEVGGNISADLLISVKPTETSTIGLHFDMGLGTGLANLPRAGFGVGRFEATLLGTCNADLEWNSDIPHLVEAWYEQSLMDEKVVFTFGMLDPTVYFDNNAFANDERTQFLAYTFVNNPGIDWGGNVNFYGPGLRLTVSPAEWLDVHLGAFATQTVSPINVEDEDEVIGFDNEFDKPMAICEVDLKPRLLGREGTYRLYGWYNAAVTRFNLEGPTKQSWGVGGSFDQLLTDNLGAFLRWSKEDPSIRQLDWTVSGGLSATGLIPGRGNDVAAVGYAVGSISNGFKDHPGCDAGTESTEQWLEAYYSLAVTPNFFLTPDIQYVIHPCGDDNEVVILGLRANAIF